MEPAIVRDPEIMHGIPVFRGTRVPVQTLFDYLEGGETLADFLEGFPTVPKQLALQAIDERGSVADVSSFRSRFSPDCPRNSETNRLKLGVD